MISSRVNKGGPKKPFKVNLKPNLQRKPIQTSSTEKSNQKLTQPTNSEENSTTKPVEITTQPVETQPVENLSTEITQSSEAQFTEVTHSILAIPGVISDNIPIPVCEINTLTESTSNFDATQIISTVDTNATTVVLSSEENSDLSQLSQSIVEPEKITPENSIPISTNTISIPTIISSSARREQGKTIQVSQSKAIQISQPKSIKEAETEIAAIKDKPLHYHSLNELLERKFEKNGNITLKLSNVEIERRQKLKLERQLRRTNKSKKKVGEVMTETRVVEIRTENAVKSDTVNTTVKEDDEEEEEGECRGPRLRVVDGQIQIDNDSLYIDEKVNNFYEENEGEVFEERADVHLTASSFAKKRFRLKWDLESTELFFKGLSYFGTDFSMISLLLTSHIPQMKLLNLTARHCKLKYTLEMKKNKKKVICSEMNRLMASAEVKEMMLSNLEKLKPSEIEMIEIEDKKSNDIVTDKVENEENGVDVNNAEIIEEDAELERRKRANFSTSMIPSVFSSKLNEFKEDVANAENTYKNNKILKEKEREEEAERLKRVKEAEELEKKKKLLAETLPLARMRPLPSLAGRKLGSGNAPFKGSGPISLAPKGVLRKGALKNLSKKRKIGE
ncbi:Transcription factor TFIIIB component B [Clydaea vesicula]|uniref:Transcription factor TFIIIB component B n=1 Tax=Clydaea vesicula TaxID=447962 RepID=A0AAD5XT69_9FUNG|nr:Transcription factor TFIIIB component B [Clydaea vesicula]